MSLCGDDQFSENKSLLNMKEIVKTINNDGDENRIPGTVGGSEKLGSSNQPRHTRGRDNTLMWRVQICILLHGAGPIWTH